MRFLVGGLDGDVRGPEAALANRFHLQFDGQSERIEAAANGVGVDAGVDERRQDHVARGAAETVEVGHAHSCMIPKVKEAG